MSSVIKKGAFIYQANTLVVPTDTPDSHIQQEVSDELINAAFGSILKVDDRFRVTALDGSGDINSVVLPPGELPQGWKAIPMRQAMFALVTGELSPDETASIGRMMRSFHIAQWRSDSRFCGSCGAPNRDSDDGAMSRHCTVCQRSEFPRISPAIIVIILNDKNEALLAHNAKFSGGIYSLIAGFNEAGENLEATVAREIKEEVNIDVKDIRYIRSQPWSFPHSLMVGFSARYNGGEITPDGVEIADAQWFPRDRLPPLPGYGTVSRYIIDAWLAGTLER